MRIHTLTMTGFGPFRHEQTVDLDAFAADGLFLISGRTGAGKSSILDAICFALYDAVPRYDGTRARLRSDHCTPDEPTRVTLEFSVADGRYLVERSPEYERPARRGGGLTKQAATATLSRRVDGDWQGLAANPRAVGAELSGLLGLNRDQFLQVILLAQNRFQRFLQSKSEDRLPVLRTLFGTKRFEQYETVLTDRRRTLEARLGESETALRLAAEQAVAVLAGFQAAASQTADAQTADAAQADADPVVVEDSPAGLSERPTVDWFEAMLARAVVLAEQTAEVANAADDAHRAAVEDLAAARSIAARQARRVAAEEQNAALVAAQAEIDALRERVAAAQRAAAVWPHLVAADEAAVELDRQRGEERDARASVLDTDRAATLRDGSVEVMRTAADELMARTGVLDQALADERTIPALTASVATARREYGEAQAELDAAAERAAALPALMQRLGEQLAAVTTVAAGLDAADAEVQRSRVAHLAAVELVELDRAVAESARLEHATGKAHTAAATHVEQLQERRLRGFAAELASALEPGEPCAVCGATEHPAPAAGDGDPVTQQHVDDALFELDARREAMLAAAAVSRDLGERAAAVRARTQGRTPDDLVVALREAQAAADAARAAIARRAALEAELAEARTRGEALAGTEAALQERLVKAAAAEVEAGVLRAQAEARAREHRAGHPSVEARVAAVSAELTRLRTAIDAIERRAAAEVAASAAGAALHAQLLLAGFESVPAMREARLADADLRTALGQVRDHDETLAAVTAVLAADDLQGLPAEPVPVAEAAEAVATLAARRDAALAERALCSARVEDLTRIVDGARGRSTASAALRSEFEVVQSLAGTVRGDGSNTRRMRLETYVLAAELEEIVAAANARLGAMTANRYTLEHDDSVQFRNTSSGLGLAIVDAHTGVARPTHSLSGGETFLASLSLALGLAEVVTSRSGGIALDTLFIDEGFGSLDADTLEVAMSTLDGLRAGGRCVGVISHVEAMREQIPAKLHIAVTAQGWSEVRQEGAAA